MGKPLSLSLLYTATLAGDLALLPRLFTFLGRLKTEAGLPILLLDLGGYCSHDVWHCRETGGRSALIALDGMGYDAANVAGALDPETRDSFAEQLTMALVDEGRDWRCQEPSTKRVIRATLRPRANWVGLQIVLSPAASTRVEGAVLYLKSVDAGEVGAAVVDLRGAPALISGESLVTAAGNAGQSEHRRDGRVHRGGGAAGRDEAGLTETPVSFQLQRTQRAQRNSEPVAVEMALTLTENLGVATIA